MAIMVHNPDPPTITELSADDLPVRPALRADTSALADLAARGFSRDEISALVVPMRTLARRAKLGEPLTVEETDKALRLQRVADLAAKVFGDPAKAYRWLRKTKRSLEGSAPLEFLASEAGGRLVEDMLLRIDTGTPG